MRRLWKIAKWTFGIALLLLLIVGGIAVFLVPKIQSYLEQQQAAGDGDVVEVQPASFGELIRTVQAPGTVVPRTDVQISARVAAKIARLPFKEGDFVQADEIVVELDSQDLQADLDAAEARLLADKANLEAANASLLAEEAAILGLLAELQNATSEFERKQELFASGDESQAVLDAARSRMESQRAQHKARQVSLEGMKANVRAAEARVAVAQAEVNRARENLEYSTIRSPITGYVTQLNAEVGEVVVTGTMNNAGTVILKVADLSEMLIECRVAEADVARVQPGQMARVHINGYRDEVFEGEVRRVALESKRYSDNTKYFATEVVLFLEGRRVYAGLTANVDIEIETVTDVIVLPSQAVLDKRVEEMPSEVKEGSKHVDRDKTFARVVFVRDDAGRASMRPVSVIASNLNQTALKGGLDQGESVITGPYRVLQTLEHKKMVKLKEGAESTDDSQPEQAIASDEEQDSQTNGKSENDDVKTTASAS